MEILRTLSKVRNMSRMRQSEGDVVASYRDISGSRKAGWQDA